MTLSNNELKKIQNFHKKMQKITGLKGNKFANKIMNKLLKNRSPWKRGGGTRNNQLGPPRGPNVDLVNDVTRYSQTIQRTDRNQTINNATLVQLQQNDNLTAVERLAIQGNQQAINQVLLQARMNSIGQFLLRLLLTGMTLGGTYQTWHLFENLTMVTRNTLNTVTPPTPAPPPSSVPSPSYRNLFGLLGNGQAPAPAPVPQLPAPPEGWVSWMMNWAFSGGNNIIYRSRIVLAWFAEVLHDLVGTGQLAATIATFILLTIVSILILKMFENGVQVWVGIAGIDTREAPRQITNNTNSLPTLRRGTSDTIRNRLTNTPGYAIEDIPEERRLITRDDTTLRQRRRAHSKSRKKKKKALKNAFSSGRNNNNFRFPPPPPPGTTSGGKRRKKKSRKRRRKRKSRRKRRKSRRKRKR